MHTYDILANPIYLYQFQYFSPAIEDRERFIIDDDSDEENDFVQSDMVKLIMNLAFLPQARARAFEFSVEGCVGQYKQESSKP